MADEASGTGLFLDIVLKGDSKTNQFMQAIQKGEVKLNVKYEDTSSSGSGAGSQKANKAQEENKGFFTKIVAGIVAGNLITSTFYDFLKPIFTLLRVVLTVVFLPLIPFMTAIINAFTAVLPGMLETSEKISDFLSPKGGTGGPKDTVASAAGLAGGLFGGAIGFLAGGPGGAIAGAAIGSNFLKGLAETTMGVTEWLRDNFMKGLDIVTTEIGKVFIGIGSALAGIWNQVAPVLEGVVNGIKTGLSGLIGNLTNAAKNTFNTLLSFFTGITNTLSSVLGGITTTISGWTTTIADALKAPINLMIDAIFGAVNALIAGLKGFKIAIGPITLPFLGKVFDGFSAQPFAGLSPLSIPHLATGGLITESGIAKVHKGETVVPAGRGQGITVNMTFNMPMTPDTQAFKAAMRGYEEQLHERLRRLSPGARRVLNA